MQCNTRPMPVHCTLHCMLHDATPPADPSDRSPRDLSTEYLTGLPARVTMESREGDRPPSKAEEELK